MQMVEERWKTMVVEGKADSVRLWGFVPTRLHSDGSPRRWVSTPIRHLTDGATYRWGSYRWGYVPMGLLVDGDTRRGSLAWGSVP